MLQSGADGRGAAQPNSVLETEEEMQQLGCQACWLFQCVVVDVENEREEREGERESNSNKNTYWRHMYTEDVY
jgi:hypothetical protein